MHTRVFHLGWIVGIYLIVSSPVTGVASDFHRMTGSFVQVQGGLPEVQVPPDQLVTFWYSKFFGRAPDVVGMQTWIDSLVSGNPPALTLATMVCGDEYYRRNGSSVGGYIRGLYRDLFGRQPFPNELQNATNKILVNGNTDQERLEVAYSLIRKAPPGNWILQNPAPGPVPPPGPAATYQIRQLNCRVFENFNGVTVATVPLASPANALGIKPGDQFIQLNQNAIRNVDQLRRALEAMPPNFVATLLMDRTGTPLTGQFQLANGVLVVLRPLGLTPETNDFGCRIRWSDRGGRVEDVRPGGLGARFGILPGDVIWGIDGQPVRSFEQLRAGLYGDNSGRARFMSVVRNGMQLNGTFRVVFNRVVVITQLQGVDSAPHYGCDLLGISVFPEWQGVRVRRIGQGSVGAQLGLVPGDIITSVAGRPVRTSEQLIAAVQARPNDPRFRIDVLRAQLPMKGHLGYFNGQLAVRVPLRPDDD